MTSAPIDLAPLFARVAHRYAASGRSARYFVAAKLRYDPVHRAVLALAAETPFGEVVDLGCGRGQLGLMLLVAGRARAVRAIDCRSASLGHAVRAGRGLCLRAGVQDLAADPTVPVGDTVLVIDLLCQLDTEAQIALLSAAARAARRLVLVRTLDPRRGLRSAATLAAEHVLRGLTPGAPKRVNALPVPALTAVLTASGFATEVVPCWEGTPFANVLIIARRPEEGAPVPGWQPGN